MPPRRRALLAALLMTTLAASAGAQSFPSRPIRIVVPFPPGGGSDLMARRLAEPLRKELGQPVIIENKPGASGNIGAESVARAAPDGHTLLVTAAPFAIAPAIFKGLAFDPLRDFTPITQIALVPLLVVTRPDAPWQTMADFVAHARRAAGRTNYATFGTGSPPHLVGESIKQLARLDMTHVPYKGGQAAMPDILSGQIDVAILDAVSMAPLVRAGRLRALAITGPKRSSMLPTVPTLSESGIAFDTVGWHALFGPAGMPPDVTARINAVVNRALADADMRAFIASGGSIAVEPATTPQRWATQFRDDVRVWADLVRVSGATSE